ncbi:MAG TPA: hypothetical protein VKZ60_09325 [Chloroflexota bacterium]|jgi:hypothetical protein|nr:hypothetical protein [Chloroflexota bacterium]
MAHGLTTVALAALLAAGVAGQVPVETVVVEGTPVHPAAYGFVYYSALTPRDVALRDGSRAELWMFDGTAGDCAELVAHAEAFAIYLILRTQAPFGTVLAEATGASGGEARLQLALPSTGRYFVTVTSVGSGEALGPYTLDLDRC